MATPSVPGAINVPTLVGNEIIAIATGGPTSAQTTASAIAALSGTAQSIKLSGITANTQLGSLPASAGILSLFLRETAGVTVSISLGTTLGASDILPPQVVIANSALVINTSDILLKAWFSAGAAQAIYVTSASWGGASINAVLNYGVVL
jgi:hypothetical protein